MAKSKQISSSAKPARSARKHAAAGQEARQLKPERQQRTAAKAEVTNQSGRDEAGACHRPAGEGHGRELSTSSLPRPSGCRKPPEPP